MTSWPELTSHLKETTQSSGPGAPINIHNDMSNVAITEGDCNAVLFNGKTVAFDLVLDAQRLTFTTQHATKRNLEIKPTQAVLRLRKSSVESKSQVFISGDDRVVCVNESPNSSDMTFIGFPELQRNDLRKSLLHQLGTFSQSIQDTVLSSSNSDISAYALDRDEVSTLPWDIQHAAVSIEDGASLGVMLGQIDSRAQIRQRVELHTNTRAKRFVGVVKLSRKLWNNLEHGRLNTQDIFWSFSHDEIHNSTHALRQHTWNAAHRLSWRQPIGFGPMMSPRQNIGHQSLLNPRGDRLGGALSLVATIRFRTSATLLRNIFPKEAYSFIKPDTVAEASYVFQGIENLSWLGGGGYNLVLFQVHDVQHTSDVDGQVRQGSFVALVMEDLTDPILSGREDLGWPKLYSEIDVRDGIQSDQDFSVFMSWRGTQWASFTWSSLQDFQQPVQSVSEEISGNTFVHKYMPATVNMPCRTAADADYDVMMPPPSTNSRPVNWNYTATEAQINISRGSEKSLPTLWHIVERLPVFEVVDAKIGRKAGQDDFSGATRV